MSKIKKFDEFIDESFKDTVRNVAKELYTELNPIEKWKKGVKYHKKLKTEVEDLEKEVEEKRKRSTNLTEGPEKTNQKIVTTPRPKIGWMGTNPKYKPK